MRPKDELQMDEFDFTQMEEQSEDLLEIRYINKNNAKFARTPGGFVSLEYQGKFYERVGVYRTFPFTDPNHYISIREIDEKAREIGIIIKFLFNSVLSSAVHGGVYLETTSVYHVLGSLVRHVVLVHQITYYFIDCKVFEI